MASTPRPRPGHYPQTPARAHRESTSSSVGGSSIRGRPRQSLPDAPEANPAATRPTPLIPLTIVDAPSQRAWAIGVYILLFGWKIYDWLQVVERHEASLWLLVKWSVLDFVYLYGLPEFRIPWLEISQPVAISLYAGHFFFNCIMMLDVPLPFQAWLLAFGKAFFDKELAISGHTVSVSNILHNNSLIMGKQIINILPEGSAVLNRDLAQFCIGPDQTSVRLPLQFNGTIPVEIELLRIDMNSLDQESIKLSKREVAAMVKQMKHHMLESGTEAAESWYTVKKPGVYRLGKVLDEYKLEVQRTHADTYVVPCPKARFQNAASSNRCIRDLSDLYLEVEGSPPLKIMYGKTVNGKDSGYHYQSLQPDDYSESLNPEELQGAIKAVSEEDDIVAARPAKIKVPLNETLAAAGDWQYVINEVQDRFGNVVNYAPSPDELDPKPRPKHLVQDFVVHERPKARLRGCDPRNPLKVAKTHSTKFPIDVEMKGPPTDDTGYTVAWRFTPEDKLTNSGDHTEDSEYDRYTAKNSKDAPQISKPGLYTLTTVSSNHCEGEIEEPSSCMLLNPVEPQLSIHAEDIADKCAGSAVGLRVDLDLMGTPPFAVRYDVITSTGTKPQFVQVRGIRHQLELRPKEAGLHKYIFRAIDDAVYKNHQLAGQEYTLEQDVKPAASAIIKHPTGSANACLDDQIEIDIMLLGDPPFSLEWELIHDGKKRADRATDITEPAFTIKTEPFTKGGDYTLTLNSVKDKSGCRTFLKDELKISVRRQRPRAGFGLLANKRSIMAVEDTDLKLPLRLQGEAPWTIKYRNEANDKETEVRVNDPNGHIPVKYQGVYKILSVSDKQCRGSVDYDASAFEVGWEPRPEISFVPSHSISSSDQDRLFVRDAVCEGDSDNMEIHLTGRPPFHVEYNVQHTSGKYVAQAAHKKLDVAQSRATIQLDTSRAGQNDYSFYSVEDNLYDSGKQARPLKLRQVVNPKPAAAFAKPGQVFKYCKADKVREDKIPIVLTGQAPFHVELEIKHAEGSTTPHTYAIPVITSEEYDIRIPHDYLSLGSQHVRIRTVRDSRGCQRTYDVGGGPSVQVTLYQAPEIQPLDPREDYCVGERIAYTLSGTPPFEITYDFNGKGRVAKSPTSSFRRVAESPGTFRILGVADKGSECRAEVDVAKRIHPLPSVRISRGRQERVDIHEGTEVDIQFEFWGTPPFEFTYTRSTNARKGHPSKVLETRHDSSEEMTKVIKASEEGTYEVVAIRDRYCAFSNQQVVRQDTKRKY